MEKTCKIESDIQKAMSYIEAEQSSLSKQELLIKSAEADRAIVHRNFGINANVPINMRRDTNIVVTSCNGKERVTYITNGD